MAASSSSRAWASTLLGLCVLANAVIFANRHTLRAQPMQWSVTLVLGTLLAILVSWALHGQKHVTGDKFCLCSHDRGKDKAKTNGIVFGKGCLDTMHLGHFLLYIALGMLWAPPTATKVGAAFLVGLAWEVVEHYTFRDTPRCTDRYCARFEDPFINTLGFITGSLFH